MKALGIILLALGILSVIGQTMRGINFSDTSNVMALGMAIVLAVAGKLIMNRATKKELEEEAQRQAEREEKYRGKI